MEIHFSIYVEITFCTCHLSIDLILYSFVSHSVMSNSLWPCGLQPPGSSVHGILQAWVLDCVAITFSRGSSQPMDWICVSCTAGKFFTVWTTREVIPPRRLYHALSVLIPGKKWWWKRWEYQTTWPASWETCMQVRKQQLELDMEQHSGSK